MLSTRGGGAAIDPIAAIFLTAGLGWAFGHGNGRCIQYGRPRKDSRYFLFSGEGAELPPGCYGGFCPDS